MNFNYLCTKRFEDSIEIPDIGNTCLDALNDDGLEYFLIIKTDLGWSEVWQFGPFTADEKPDEYYFCYTHNKFQFSEKGVKKTINLFLNNESKQITQVTEIQPSDAFDLLKGVFE